MRPFLIVLIFSSTVFARYHEKTRFDRSVGTEHEATNTENDDSGKQWSFTDQVTQFVAYKSSKENDCYLQNLKQDHPLQRNNVSYKKRQPKILYTSETLTKLEAWRLAGGRIVEFCNGRSIFLLQTTRPTPDRTLDPFLNEIPEDENDILSKVADIFLTPLLDRAKRQIQLEEQEKLNENLTRVRQHRQTTQFRGKFRGQTQSQYLNVGSEEQKEGKAEAEATQQSSRAVVIGSHGIGQAQSMSSGGTGCEDCPGYPGGEIPPDKLHVPESRRDGVRYVQGPIVGTSTPGVVRPETGVVPGITQPGGPYGVTSTGQIIYPGGVTPGVPGTYREVVPGTGTRPAEIRPGGVLPSTLISGIAQPGITTLEGTGMYPGSIRPGTVIPGVHGTYPEGVRPGIPSPIGDGTYRGVIQPGTAPTGGDGTYIGTVPQRIVPTGEIGTSREGIPSTSITGDSGLYPTGVQPGSVTTAGRYPGTAPPGTITGGVGTYLGVVQPGVPPGVVKTSVIADTGVGSYPSGVVPGISLPNLAGLYPGRGTETYLGGVIPGRTISQGVYPGAQQIGVTYPGGIVPGIPPGGVTYPSGTTGVVQGHMPGMIATTGSVADASAVISYPRPTDGRVAYPHPGAITQLGRVPDGTRVSDATTYPGGTYPGTIVPTVYYGDGRPQVSYPGDTQQVIRPGATLYPGQATYPGSRNGVVTDQVTTFTGGQYPGISVTVPGRAGIQYPIGTTGGQTTIGRTEISKQYPAQYPSGIGGQEVGTGRYPARPYPGADGTTGIGEVPQYYAQPGGQVVDDGAESQSSSSVQQVNSGTQASASAQGKYGQGVAQSQVTGTYNGSGSFSAQAGTKDVNKSAQAEISGGKDGATSNAQGVAGYGKSQTQVQLDSDSGATSTDAQSSGWNHGTNSQVQASSKGGMADAQANGEGSTSSQAQIGFQPYSKSNEKVEKRAKPFHGSGTASAQSSAHRGQSQSQLQGSFQYGITYTGAAQAGSGSGAASSRKPFNFNVTDTDLFKPFKPKDSLNIPANSDSAQLSLSESVNHEDKQGGREQGLQSSSTSRQTVVISSAKNNSEGTEYKKVLAIEKPRTDDTYDEYDNEYTDEDYDSTVINPITVASKASSGPSHHDELNKTEDHQTQMIQVTKENQYDFHINQDSSTFRTGDMLQPGQSLSGYTIPPGFRGRVISTSGSETIAQGNGNSQSQTVSLIPKRSNSTKSPITETRSLYTNHKHYIDRHKSDTESQRFSANQNVHFDKHKRPPAPNMGIKPSYYTVTNSIAGKMNGSNAPRKYEHRYYTKSSTCGYFTFSCNAVYGTNGRTKICKPKVPTYSDGTPVRC